MHLYQCEMNDFENVVEFYDQVIDAVNQTDINLCWVKGIHPSEQFIWQSIHDGECLITKDSSGQIEAAAILNDTAIPEYQEIPWSRTEEDGGIAYLHVLSTDPLKRGSELSEAFIKAIIQYSKEKGDCAIHLDVKNGNIPAIKLYEKAGFALVEKHWMVYPTTGRELFYMYEYNQVK